MATRKQALRFPAGGLLFLLVLAAGSTPALAEVYKWVDSAGKVHYADQPPSVDAQTVRASSSSQGAITQEATRALDAREQDYQKRKKDADEAKAKADKEAALARAKQENCDKARNNLTTLQSKPRVYSTNAAGQRVYLDDRARADALANSQKAIAENCK